jgi:hypothetical protein
MELGYVKGFFDRMCHVDEAGRAIVLTSDMVDLSRRVAARLHEEGIECDIKVRDDRAQLRVSGRRSLQFWDQLIGFDDGSKREKLHRILASYGS